jgi:hypothetical protein
MTEVGLILGRNPTTILAPDVPFVRRDRAPAAGELAGWLNRGHQ